MYRGIFGKTNFVGVCSNVGVFIRRRTVFGLFTFLRAPSILREVIALLESYRDSVSNPGFPKISGISSPQTKRRIQKSRVVT
jgi:hypothetical protein